jgi:hypothetical protein
MIFSMMLAVAQPARGACLNWARYVGAPTHSLQYAGTLGDHPIRMMLHLDAATSRLIGAYGYNDQPGILQLTGDLRSGGEGVDLVEHDQQGRDTGRFDLQIFRQRRFGEMRNPLPGCDNLVGKWQPAKGGKPLNVTLYLAGESNPVYDQARERNEIAAYKLRQAMLDQNPAAFASLLQYPFYSEHGHGVVSVWNSQQDVIDNYKQIVFFPDKAVRDVVPHILAGGGTRSEFMNGSVYIDHGKVTRICEEACPVIP